MANRRGSKTDSRTPVNECQLNEAIQKQEDIFKAIFQTQESTLKMFIESFMETTNKRVDSFMYKITNELSDLRHALEFTQGGVDVMRKTFANQATTCIEIEKKMTEIQICVSKLESQVDYLENQSRRNNLRFEGIAENQRESWSETESKIREVLKTKMKFDDSKIEIERAHRTGPKEASNSRPRSIVFISYYVSQ